MALEELFRAVDRERRRLKEASIILGCFGLFMVLLYFSSLYLHAFRWGRLSQEEIIVDTLGILTGVFSCYFSLREILFLRKLSKRMEESVISSALDLLDHYEETYKNGRNFFLIFSIVFGFAFLSWIIGWQVSWWKWSYLVFVALISFIVVFVIFSVLLLTILGKLAKKAKGRKDIERGVQEYLKEEDLGAEETDAGQVKG